MTKAAPLAIISSLPVILGCALLGATEARADYIVTIDQEGPDVVARGSGTINTLGLPAATPQPGIDEPATINSGSGRLEVGSGQIQFWGMGVGTPVAFSGPSNFGSGTLVNATIGTGDPTGINVGPGFLAVPLGYTSNASLDGTATWSGATLAGLGLTPGLPITWTWGSGGTAGSFTIHVVPGPIVGAGLPGLIAALGGLIAMARRRRKQLA